MAALETPRRRDKKEKEKDAKIARKGVRGSTAGKGRVRRSHRRQAGQVKRIKGRTRSR